MFISCILEISLLVQDFCWLKQNRNIQLEDQKNEAFYHLALIPSLLIDLCLLLVNRNNPVYLQIMNQCWP
ncbi:hypothetical protein GDO78_015272 [Eleutherodactylus coqui]|uniref:Uncharacterized protein n=1 Tax=Eleutherodactylus coqui TaxID=57060 RepID=A0A8J6EM23_ELECQ|nr:hypothetical protein GDO78_015272 [Eleutherodactylus coqui]